MMMEWEIGRNIRAVGEHTLSLPRDESSYLWDFNAYWSLLDDPCHISNEITFFIPQFVRVNEYDLGKIRKYGPCFLSYCQIVRLNSIYWEYCWTSLLHGGRLNMFDSKHMFKYVWPRGILCFTLEKLFWIWIGLCGYGALKPPTEGKM